MYKQQLFPAEMAVYFTFTAAGLELMARTRELDSDMRAIFRDLSAMRVYHAGAITQAMKGTRSSWVYDKFFTVFAYPDMEAGDIIPAIEMLRDADTYAINSPYKDADQISSCFVEAAKSLETQRKILNTLQDCLEATSQERLYICRHCGYEYERKVERVGRDADKCPVCGAPASSFRAEINWNIII